MFDRIIVKFNMSEYLAYCEHPAHVDFVQQRWLSEVADFREADFEPLTTSSG